MAALSTRFSVSLAQSQDFARLSGDFNPMHVDPVRARRTQYGSSVVHGIHLLLKSMEYAVAAGALPLIRCEALSVLFSNPVRTGTEVTLNVDSLPDDKVRFSGESDGRVLFVATLSLGDERVAPYDIPNVAPSIVREPDAAASRPEHLALGRGGQFAIGVPMALMRSFFPALASMPWGLALAADLLASTRIVGMEVPGLHSIYSGLKLKRREAVAGDRVQSYKVTKVDPRFRMVRLAFTGGVLEGLLETFLRPAPVEQPALRQVMQHIVPGAYQGQRALVVGGSRGLGELTAKILLAGDADVTITYARGEADARRVCDEAVTLDKSCSALHLDVSDAMDAAAVQRLRAVGFTHVYYFASPHIAKGTPGTWRDVLFRTFTCFYLDGFDQLMTALSPAPGTLRVLYPSTVFLDQPEKGFAEYCAAKAAGETLCGHLAQHHQIEIRWPRLPRMKTDQTSAVTDSDMGEPLPVMLAVLKAFLG